MRISKGISRLFRRVRVEWVIAVVMLALAYFTLTARSLAVLRLEDVGWPREAQTGVLAIGAVATLASHGRDYLFYLGTIPLLFHVITALCVTIENRGGYHTAIIYWGFLLLMYIMYARQEESCE